MAHSYGGNVQEAMKKQDRDAIRQIMTLRNKIQGYDKAAEKAKEAEARKKKLADDKASRERSAKERKEKEKAAMKGLP